MPNGDTGTGGGGFLERLRNSPRTVSTIIVILIVVGAIFAFSDRGQPPTSPTPAVTESPAAESTPTPEGEATPTPKADASQGAKATEAPATPIPTPLPEAQETEGAYVEVAARGEGVTHLARKAMLRSVEASKPDFDLTVEHKVWIEDYVKDRIGRKPLAVGENVAVDKNLIREAVEQSKLLSDAQLQHLKRYSQRVAAYRSAQ